MTWTAYFLSHGDTDHSGGLYIFPDKIAVKNIYYNSLTIDKSEETLLAEYRKSWMQADERSGRGNAYT